MLQKVRASKRPDTTTRKGLLIQFSRYLVTGFLSVGIEFTLLILLVEQYQVNYLLANAFAFIITNLCNYFISRHWVFEQGKHKRHVEFIIFFVTASIGLIINQTIMWVMVEYVAVDYRLSKLAAVGIVILWNFWARKKLVFKG